MHTKKSQCILGVGVTQESDTSQKSLVWVQEAAAEEVCDLSWGEFKPRLADAVSTPV